MTRRSRRFCSLCLASMAASLLLMATLFTLDSRPTVAEGSTLYVSPDSVCGGALPCYGIIQQAVDAASNGDTVKVAQGVYTATGFQVVYIDKSLTLVGGYTSTDWVNSYPATRPTVIDAESVARRRGVYVSGNPQSSVILQGFTIQRGYAEHSNGGGVYVGGGTVKLQYTQLLTNSATDGPSSGDGGGVYVKNGSFELEGNIFRGNSAVGHGGGVHIRDGTAVLINNVYQNNSAGYGGGLSVLTAKATARGNLLVGNSAYNGGGMWARGAVMTMATNTLQENSADYVGGGIYMDCWEGVTLVDGNSFISNTAWTGGGANIDSGDVTVVHNTFQGNSALGGGAVRGGGLNIEYGTVLLISNKFQGNFANDHGGAISIAEGGSMSLDGNLILDNSAGGYGGGLSSKGAVAAQNDIIADNSAVWEAVSVTGGTLSARHWTLVNNGKYALTTNGGLVLMTNTIVASHTAGGLAGPSIYAHRTLFFDSGVTCSAGASCTGSIWGDPLFRSLEGKDYHIGSGSPAIDRGVNAGVITDVDGEPRPMRAGYDLGADEVPPSARFSTSSPDWLGQTSLFTSTSVTSGTTETAWLFGDGGHSTGKWTAHSYTRPGQFTVTLTVTDSHGTDTTSDTVTIYSKPDAGFVVTPVVGSVPLSVTFLNTTTTVPQGDTTLTYLWHLGDGHMSSLPNPLHVYALPGVFTVTLTSSNAAGSNTITRTHIITAIGRGDVHLPVVMRTS